MSDSDRIELEDDVVLTVGPYRHRDQADSYTPPGIDLGVTLRAELSVLDEVAVTFTRTLELREFEALMGALARHWADAEREARIRGWYPGINNKEAL